MRIGMLGPLEVRADDGGLADVPGARLRGLLVALALRPGQVVPKASLVDWIWGERPPADAANALQRLVSRLRKALPGGVIEGQPDGYRLLVEPDAVDAVRFERLVGAGQGRAEDGARRVRRLREGLELWRGTAMQDVGPQDSAAFEAAVVRLEGLRLTATEERAEAEVTLGRGAELVAELTDLVAAHPVRERLVGALMRALVAAGRDSEALQVYQRAREALADALGVDPSPELAALHVALLRGELGRREESPRTNLRAELTSFVGRGADVAAVRGLIAEHRLTTVIGPGGAGKTRLATETARTLLGDGELPDGAWLVELAAIGADGDVAQSALAGLGLRDALLGAAPNAELTDRLIAAVREREALLILDNCEHVIESAAVFAHRVLGECRRLRILATSREPLGITGEALWPVEPLALPEGDAGPDEIGSAPAVQLLRDRAGAVRRGLAADVRTLATMVRVCRALDGMPLAIELAAARLRTMSIDQLAHRLDDRFRLLTSGSRTALPRHKTLRAMVDWSWELLTDAERTVLRRLSVFSGGASLEAAERVCAGDGVEREQVLELLTALTEKSLLVAEGGGAPRYRMIGTIREYAGHRLAEAGESDLARHAHLAHFTELTETAEPRLRRAEQVEWLATLEAEHDNIGAAMRGALAAGEASAAMRLAAGAGWYWWLGGRRTEGLELITAATRTPGEVPDDVRAMVYALIVHFVTSGRSDERQAAEWIHEAHRLSRRGHYHPGVKFIAVLERMLHTPEAALTAFAPLLDDADPWVCALARWHMGKMRIVFGLDGQERQQDGPDGRGGQDRQDGQDGPGRQDGRDGPGRQDGQDQEDQEDQEPRGSQVRPDGPTAQAYLEAALAEFRALGERYGISLALTELANLLAVRGDFAGACDHYEQAIAVVSEVGATEDVIRLRSRQAQLYWLLGDKDAGAAAMAEARRCAERVTWPDALAELAFARAELARWDGDAEEARRQLGLATAMLGGDAERADIRAVTHDLLGYLADDLGEARAHRAAACEAAVEVGYVVLTAHVLVGVADLALRRDEHAQAARLLAASTAVRGRRDHAHPDLARIERAARGRLGDAKFAEATRDGTRTSWSQLVEVTLAS
ncbi:BTAD domain-containing putative transcriptional regulator [Streptomyces rugosispiralis]|uniref:Winged helix-turn-helix domain-containing protein n=1 Tax=Streptomyces rugosispiralis TaxID=2967341 RepID=A0ABT1VA31_9ACTN|nr:BTAD domain-containing putative transcriptional regulator [Streptomyces rugosispiralis]MCQ8194247.1 winged helix-turn-helix domain-containing protein [Streptomyces rugosispiralis]